MLSKVLNLRMSYRMSEAMHSCNRHGKGVIRVFIVFHSSPKVSFLHSFYYCPPIMTPISRERFSNHLLPDILSNHFQESPDGEFCAWRCSTTEKKFYPAKEQYILCLKIDHYWWEVLYAIREETNSDINNAASSLK